jgi:hypothetical protein
VAVLLEAAVLVLLAQMVRALLVVLVALVLLQPLRVQALLMLVAAAALVIQVHRALVVLAVGVLEAQLREHPEQPTRVVVVVGRIQLTLQELVVLVLLLSVRLLVDQQQV